MSDLLDDDTSQGSLTQVLSLARLWADFRKYYLLLVGLMLVCFAAVVVLVVVSKPRYIATAVVGPADNSDLPISPLSMGALGGSLGGIAKHLHVGGMLGQQGMDDNFDEYSSLLTSNRLLGILARKDHILPEIFPDDWDWVHHRWRSRDDAMSRTIDYLKLLFHRPVKPAPDQDDLQKYFEQNLVVDPSLETSFATISFRFRSPQGAERILGMILRDADNVIREDKRRDVASRIAFLNTALERLSLADQKPELIDILSDQEQEMMILESDRLYASTLIDTPYAPLKPTSPSPILDTAIALVLAFFAWLGLVRTVPQEGRWARLLAIFARRPRENRTRTAAHPRHEDPLADALPLPAAFDSRAVLD